MEQVLVFLTALQLASDLGSDSYLTRAKAEQQLRYNLLSYGPYLDKMATEGSLEQKVRLGKIVDQYYAMTAESKAAGFLAKFDGYLPWVDGLSHVTKREFDLDHVYFVNMAARDFGTSNQTTDYQYNWPQHQTATYFMVVELCSTKKGHSAVPRVLEELRLAHIAHLRGVVNEWKQDQSLMEEFCYSKEISVVEAEIEAVISRHLSR